MWIALICKCTEKSEKKDSFGIVYCNGNPDLVRLESWNPRLLHIFPILLQADFLKKQLEAQKAEIEKLKGKAGLAFSFLLSLYLLAASSDERNRNSDAFDPGEDPGVYGGGAPWGMPWGMPWSSSRGRRSGANTARGESGSSSWGLRGWP